MKSILKAMTLAVLLAFVAGPLYGMEKNISPGGGQSPGHSNAPSTGSQVKGKTRAEEVGKGKEKGLHKTKHRKNSKGIRTETETQKSK